MPAPLHLAAALACLILAGDATNAAGQTPSIWRKCPGPACPRKQAYIDLLLDRYEDAHAPLTPYAADLVAALRSMDVDLAQATTPTLRHIGNRTVPVHPIGFSIPPEQVRAVVPAKGRALMTVIPDAPETYKYAPQPRANPSPAKLLALERDYYADIERSLFGLTWKKGGWDCMRHLELLAAGCVPLFTDIEAARRGAVSFLPKKVLARTLRFPGIEALTGVPGLPSADGHRHVAINITRTDPVLYSLTVTALLDDTRRHLTTPAMASHMLRVMGFQPPFCARSGLVESMVRHWPRELRHVITRSELFRSRRPWPSENNSPEDWMRGHVPSNPCPNDSHRLRVLYLTPAADLADYLTETLLHGLVTLLGPTSVVQFPRRDALYTTPGLLFEDLRGPVRAYHYGFGFSYAHTLFDLQDASNPWAASTTPGNAVEENVRAAIAAREFDFVILSQIHRGRPPLLDAVCASYPRHMVAAVHGHDPPPRDAEVEEYMACAGHFFAREAMEVT